MSDASPPALRLTIDGEALAANWRWLRDRGGGAACGAAVKADGYGLGARETVKRLAREGCRDFFVSSWAEAAALGRLPDGGALSVLHGVREADMRAALAGPARPVLNSPEQVARWKAAGGGVCDVMIDTGINRLGLRPDEARSGLLDDLAIDTLMSHLACADEPNHPMNERQLAAFRAMQEAIPARRYSLANSAGICLGTQYSFCVTRPGLALYGGIPVIGNVVQEHGLQTVMQIEAEIIQIRDVEPSETVGYGATWTAWQRTRVAILNIGYADGLFRTLQPHIAGRAGERQFGLLGRISMDLVALDVTDYDIDPQAFQSMRVETCALTDVREGDWIALPFDLPRLSSMSGASQYELLTGLGRRYQRRWI